MSVKLKGKWSVASILYGLDKKKHRPMAGVSFWVPAAKGRLHPPEILMLGVGRAAPAQFAAALGRGEFTAHSRRRPEGRFLLLGGDCILFINTGQRRSLEPQRF